MYLVVLLLPLLLLLLDCVWGGGGGGGSGASVFGHSFQPTERLNEAYAAEFVSLSTLLHFACFRPRAGARPRLMLLTLPHNIM